MRETPHNLQFEADFVCDFGNRTNEVAHSSLAVQNNSGVIVKWQEGI